MTDDTSYPKILLGGPVRDRGWILPAYLYYLENLDYPKDRITLCFVVNDSTDDSLAQLERFAALRRHRYRDVRLIEVSLGAPPDERERERRLTIFSTLAEARNRFLTEVTDEDFVFSVDTDILVPSDALKRLVAAGKDVVAARVWNDPQGHYPNFLVRDGEYYRHVTSFTLEPFRVDVTGAVYLFKAAVARQARYGFHIQGEDVPFCESARAAGFEIWVDPSIFCLHMLSKEILQSAR